MAKIETYHSTLQKEINVGKTQLGGVKRIDKICITWRMVMLSRPLLFLRYSVSLCAICLYTMVFPIIIAILHYQKRLLFGHEYFPE